MKKNYEMDGKKTRQVLRPVEQPLFGLKNQKKKPVCRQQKKMAEKPRPVCKCMRCTRT